MENILTVQAEVTKKIRSHRGFSACWSEKGRVKVFCKDHQCLEEIKCICGETINGIEVEYIVDGIIPHST